MCGDNNDGELGDGTFVSKSTLFMPPGAFQGSVNRIFLSGSNGYTFTYLTTTNGTVWNTGYNFYGQLGRGNNIANITSFGLVPLDTSTRKPVGLSGFGYSNFSGMTIGFDDGTLWATGRNEGGQAGVNLNITPAEVLAFTPIDGFGPTDTSGGLPSGATSGDILIADNSAQGATWTSPSDGSCGQASVNGASIPTGAAAVVSLALSPTSTSDWTSSGGGIAASLGFKANINYNGVVYVPNATAAGSATFPYEITVNGVSVLSSTLSVNLTAPTTGLSSYPLSLNHLANISVGDVIRATLGNTLPGSTNADITLSVDQCALALPAGSGPYDVVQTLVEAPTINWDASAGYNALLTLTASRTLGIPINIADGRTLRLTVRAGATGPHTLTFNTAYRNPQGTSVSASSIAANTSASFLFVYDSTNARFNQTNPVVASNALGGPWNFYYQQAPGVGGGNALVSSWTPYPFNTDSALNAAGVARASTTFGIVAAGTYSVDCRLTFRGVSDCQIRLRNTTSNTTVANSTTSNHFSSVSSVSGFVDIKVRFAANAADNFQIQYNVTSSLGTFALGTARNVGEPEVYGMVEFQRLA
jgi:hypothetical protein